MFFPPGAVPAMRPAHPRSLHVPGANRKARRPRRTAGDLSSGETGPRLIRAVHRRARRSNRVDDETDIAIVLHESVEIDLPQHQQPAIGHGDDIGLARHAAEKRLFTEEVAAAERDTATRKDHFGGAWGDEVAGAPLVPPAYDPPARPWQPGPEQLLHPLELLVVESGEQVESP